MTTGDFIAVITVEPARDVEPLMRTEPDVTGSEVKVWSGTGLLPVVFSTRAGRPCHHRHRADLTSCSTPPSQKPNAYFFAGALGTGATADAGPRSVP